MKRSVLAGLAALFLVGAPTVANAQLLGDRVQDNQRQCTYVGSTQLANGEIVQRNTIVPASQPCPDIAPFDDPNRPAPGNAALLREAVAEGQRQCVYSQGGVEYIRAIAATRYCAQTPDLLDQELAEPDPAGL